jgi:cytoskeletal protein CcmA (bactofilin family)
MAQYTTTESGEAIFYTSGSPSTTYPDDTFQNVFGPVLLPRIYGRDLTALEIGSSGKIVITINDAHSFDFSNANNGTLTYLQGRNQNAFKIAPADAAETTALGDFTTHNESNYQVMHTSNANGFHFSNDVRVQGNAALQSDLDVALNTRLQGTLGVLSATSLSNTLHVEGNVDFSNDFQVNGAVSFSNTLHVDGAVDFSNDLLVRSNVRIQEDLDVDVDTRLQGTLGVLGAASLSNTLHVQGDVDFSNDLLVRSNVRIQEDLDVDADTRLIGTLGVLSAVSFSNTLHVQGDVDFSNDLLVRSNVRIQEDLDVDVNTRLQGTLGVLSGVSLSNTLHVQGDVDFSNDLTVQSNVTINGYLTVNDGVILNSNLLVEGPGLLIPRGDTASRPSPPQQGFIRYNTETSQFEGFGAAYTWGTLGGVIDVDQDTFVSAEDGAGTNDDNLRFFTAGLRRMVIQSNGDIRIDSNLQIEGRLDVTDKASFSNQTEMLDTLTLRSNLIVDGPADFNNTLNVDGAATLQSTLGVLGAASFSNTLYVEGVTTLSNDVIMNNELLVKQAAEFSNDVTIHGTTTLLGPVSFDSSATFKGDITGSNNLYIVGDSYLYSNVYISSNLDVKQFASFSNDVRITGSLTVDTNELIKGTLTVQQATVLSNQLLVKQDAMFEQNVGVEGDLTVDPLNILYVNTIQSDGNGSTELNITASTVKIHGNLDVTGTVNTVNSTEINVEDKLVTLSYSESNLVDGIVSNDGAGIRVFGLPDTVDPSFSNNAFYEKSIRWNYGVNGVESLRTSNLDAESFWEVMGGSLRITTHKDTSGSNYVSYGFRINQNDELEFIKAYSVNNNVQYKRIAKFGVMLGM